MENRENDYFTGFAALRLSSTYLKPKSHLQVIAIILINCKPSLKISRLSTRQGFQANDLWLRRLFLTVSELSSYVLGAQS